MSKKSLVGTFLSIGVLVAVFAPGASAFWPFDGWAKKNGEVKAATTDQSSRSSIFDRLRSKRDIGKIEPAMSTDSALFRIDLGVACTDGVCTDAADIATKTKQLEDKVNGDTKNKLVLSSPTNSKLDVMAKMCARSATNSKLNSVYSKWFSKRMAALGFSSRSKYNPENDYKSYESEFESICSQITALDKKVDTFEGMYKGWMSYANSSVGRMPVPTGVSKTNCTYQAVQCVKAPCPEIAICVTPTPKREPNVYIDPMPTTR